MLNSLCAPALLYLGFSLTQIVIDVFTNQFNKAIVKFIIMIIFTIILNMLCNKGLSIISWIVVFLPFIMLTYITSIILFVFNLEPNPDNLDYKIKEK